MSLPLLYSKTSLGQIQVWQIIVVGDSFFTREGILNGKMTDSTPTVCLPKNTGKKNATTGEEQAQKEALARHNKKKKSGGYWEDINDVDKIKFTEPMLAEKLKDFRNKVIFPCMVDIKYNGGRVVSKIDGLFTRKGETYKSIPHIHETLKPLFVKFPSLVLDGEGYNHEYRYKLNDMMSILRKTKDEHIDFMFLQESESIVRYYVYDGFNFEIDGKSITEETPCIERREALKKLLKDVQYIVVADYTICNSFEEIDDTYNKHVSDGYEGAMVRNMNSTYKFKRTTDLLKVKPEDDSEAIIISVDPGTGNASSLAATATLKWIEDKDQVFNATFKGEKWLREKILSEKDKWIGKKVKFLYNGLTGLGIPNYARIDPENCSPLK